jgi:hypothetical protein
MNRTEFLQNSICIAAFGPVVMVLLCGDSCG